MKQRSNSQTQTMNEILAECENESEQMLFGPLWYKGQIAVLAGDTGKGKSLLAYTIADAISNGKSAMDMPVEVPQTRVLFWQQELKTRDFKNRYFGYKFSDNLIKLKNKQPTITDIREALLREKAEVLIIDNLSHWKFCFKGAKTFKEEHIFMELEKLNQELGVSILLVCHVNKGSGNKPLTLNSIAGSKNIVNFADSVFFIAPSSQGQDIRYIKSEKSRMGTGLDGYVKVYTIHKCNNFTTLDYIQDDDESNHIVSADNVPGSNRHTPINWEEIFEGEAILKHDDIIKKLEAKGIGYSSARNYIKWDLKGAGYGKYTIKNKEAAVVNNNPIANPSPQSSANTIGNLPIALPAPKSESVIYLEEYSYSSKRVKQEEDKEEENVFMDSMFSFFNN